MILASHSLASSSMVSDYFKSVEVLAGYQGIEILPQLAVHNARLSTGLSTKRKGETAPHQRRQSAEIHIRLDAVGSPQIIEEA